MNGEGINRQGWFAISLGSVFLIGLVILLAGGQSDKIPIATPENPTRPPISPSQEQRHQGTQEYNLIQNLIRPERAAEIEIISGPVSQPKGVIKTITTALSRTAGAITSLTQNALSQILPDNQTGSDSDKTAPTEATPTEELISDPSGDKSLIADPEEDSVFYNGELRLIEGANPISY